jgi:hypothetical protein
MSDFAQCRGRPSRAALGILVCTIRYLQAAQIESCEVVYLMCRKSRFLTTKRLPTSTCYERKSIGHRKRPPFSNTLIWPRKSDRCWLVSEIGVSDEKLKEFVGQDSYSKLTFKRRSSSRKTSRLRTGRFPSLRWSEFFGRTATRPWRRKTATTRGWSESV